MGIIRLHNVRVYASHGCLKEETIIGSDYLVQLEVKADLQKAAATDDLNDTVDYVHLNRIIKEEMAVPSKLLEVVARKINTRILKELPMVSYTKVCVAKINPPIGGDVASVEVCLEDQR
ncbi:dihydroneopterin aldolase [Gilvibacter sp. SZ-19]|uniref:dihydroneopterin aldolase n=1 Tax=Gilvibacter sp. SZ-19 TaxID=754429 RepID=UPI000B3CEE83|nr:dihydroneopterin aldolase [Gilvibacter sp. SZ-19]ARV11869.1 dihydroneopterin aldolase [Gilvibacter sp. SZ-19]